MQRRMLPPCLALVLTFLLPGHTASPNCTADRLEFQSAFESSFSQLSRDAGSLEPLYDMVNRYLDAVQPNPFPTDIVEQLLKGQSVEPLKVVKYEAGYLVSLIIGALFFIFMPLVGLFFCCCRCCKRCGGQVKERTDSTDCQRNTLALFLLMTTIIILAGVACAFTANQEVTDAMEPSLAAIKDTLANVTSYVDNLVKAISKIGKQFSVPKEKTLTELGRIGRTFGSTIQDTLAPIITPVLAMLMNRIQEFSRIKNHLLTINSSQISLQESQRQLKDNLTRIQGEINTTLRFGCVGCEPLTSVIENLELNINYTQSPEFQALLAKFTSISEDKLNNSLQKGNQAFNEIPSRARNETSRILSEANATLGKIERQIQGVTEDFSFTEQLQNLNNTLKPSQYDPILASVKQYDYYRWVVGIVLCCIILLIIACNVLGLGLGTTGIATRSNPYSANCSSQSGANFLMAGVGFSFIFSWLLILLVFVTFFVGGNVQTLVCKPWKSGEIYEAVDTLGAASSDLNQLSLLGVQINFSELHRHCEQGNSLFNFLPTDQKTQLNKALNLSTYTAELEKVEELNVDLGTVVLLDSAGNSTLMDIANSGIDSLNYTQFIEQVQQPIVKIQLLRLADQLDELRFTQNSEVRGRLSGHSADLRELQRTSVSAIEQELATLNASFQFLASFTPTIKSEIQKTLQSTATAESQIKPSTLTALRNVSQCLLSKERGYFSQYLDWARSTIIDDLLSCQAVMILLENSRVISCEYIIEPWNAFWFCLGWCTLFLIPSIIFAVKTAKHYRPVKNKASSPDFAEMTNLKFPRAQNKYTDPDTNLYSSPTF